MIALITPTGGRLKAFELCAKLMRRQDIDEKVLWIIVDDVVPSTTNCVKEDDVFAAKKNNKVWDYFSLKSLDTVGGFKPNWEVVKLFPVVQWKPGMNTQSDNLEAGLSFLQRRISEIRAIFFIEDDDYYRPDYLRKALIPLNGYQAAGATRTVYYNTVTRTSKKHKNDKHSSLFQTVITPAALPVFMKVLSMRKKFIDIYFWDKIRNHGNLYQTEGEWSVGIKGMSGRPGIGNGHVIVGERNPLGIFELEKLIGKDYLLYL